MLDDIRGVQGVGLRTPQAIGLMDHPVFSVMSSVIRSLISSEARRLTLMPGEEAPEDSLIFVMRGLLELFNVSTGVTAGVLGPMSVLGGVGPACNEPATRGRAIVDTHLYVVPLSVLSKASGSAWSRRFAMAHTSSRSRLLGVERMCRDTHSPAERLAKWSVRLSPFLSDSNVCLTLPALSQLVGLSEDELIETWVEFANEGSLAPLPGDFSNLALGRLKQRACACDLSLDDGGLERRSHRRLMRRQ